MRYDRVRRVLGNRVGSFARGDLYGYGVLFRRSIQVVYVDEPESRTIGISRSIAGGTSSPCIAALSSSTSRPER